MNPPKAQRAIGAADVRKATALSMLLATVFSICIGVTLGAIGESHRKPAAPIRTASLLQADVHRAWEGPRR